MALSGSKFFLVSPCRESPGWTQCPAASLFSVGFLSYHCSLLRKTAPMVPRMARLSSIWAWRYFSTCLQCPSISCLAKSVSISASKIQTKSCLRKNAPSFVQMGLHPLIITAFIFCLFPFVVPHRLGLSVFVSPGPKKTTTTMMTVTTTKTHWVLKMVRTVF